MCARAPAAAVTLVATDTWNNRLYRVDPATAVTTLIGPLGVQGIPASLAWDPDGGVLYGTTTGWGHLCRIDPSTGAATIIADLPSDLIHGLAFNRADGWLYGVEPREHDSVLYRIHPGTGAVTILGFPQVPSLSGLDYDAAGDLIACVASSFVVGDQGGLYRINTATATATLITTTRRLTSIAFNPETGELLGVNNGIGTPPRFTMYRIDPSTGASALVGEVGDVHAALGLEFIPSPGTGVALCLTLLGALGSRRRG